ncbi:hypothetical protein AGMMS49587_04820 [Spirochaetia bacterium]|nr:hypothetical protein AGMMS49587_04820 [Spirochaetia bacterium]
MNTSLCDIIKKLVSEQGTDVLNDSKKVNAYLSDLAAKEPKPQRMAFVKCLMYGFHTELQKTSIEDRQRCKNRLAQKLFDDEGLDISLSRDTLDLLEAVLFETVTETSQSEPSPVVEVPSVLIGKVTPTPDVHEASPARLTSSPITAPDTPTQAPHPPKSHAARNLIIVAIGIFAILGFAIFVTTVNNSNQSQSTAETFFLKGYTLSTAGNYDQAIVEYSEAIQRVPNDAYFLNMRAYTYDCIGQFDKALIDANKSLQLQPNDSHALDTRATAYRGLGDYQKALADYNESIRLNPNSAEVLNNRSYLYALMGNESASGADEDKAIQMDRNMAAQAAVVAGTANHYQGNYEGAIILYNHALSIDPDDKMTKKILELRRQAEANKWENHF